ncbi:Rhs_assc_core: RHS repeat-associated core domain protein [Kordia sp. SMS9]|uniref:DUF6443 domain-containing protein n=1 Tax=Kordia sp. SMS9 TaxID=2282170 RepID=UPI000E102D75|nr:DUF6443 domain-containing protein [Kordia sp. SMS9]AXG67851.1 Rhs_assc_core: RHS repeat-associated core domain protein [Kordia sp. SMS9]
MKKYIFALLLICGLGLTANAQRNCLTHYYDLDRDGYGSILFTGTETVTSQFAEHNRLVCNNDDCDDTDPEINPDSYWVVFVDGDGDGSYIVDSVENACVPTNQNAVLIGENVILENFSGLQLDCNDADGSITQAIPYYEDVDGDGFGDIGALLLSCAGTPPSGYVINAGDTCPNTFGLYNGCPDVTTVVGIDQNRNYVHTIAYQQPVYLTALTSIQERDKLEQITYFDGLGRAQMKIAIGQSPKDNRDIKTIVSYDSYGRANTQFLPYVSTQKGGGFFSPASGGTLSFTAVDKEIKYQQQFYHNKYSEDVSSFVPNNGGLTMLNNLGNIPQELLDDIPNDTPETGFLYPSYSTNVYDEIDRVTQAAAPGKDWSLEFNHTIKMQYDLNDQTVDAVKRFDVTHPVGAPEDIQFTANGLYPSETLYKTITKDENWQPGQTYPTDHTTEEFKNKSGQVVLKRTYDGSNTLDTYYIYDDFGNLTYVLPPMASIAATIDTDVLNTLCYQYKYDHRNRLIEKKIPAKGWEYIVYDTLDRPILTQDVNLRTKDKWLFTKYDALGRVVYTGKFGDKQTRGQLQSIAENYPLYESKTTTPSMVNGTSVYYTNNAYPNDGTVELYTVNYYDDYLWDTGTSYEANYNLNESTGVLTTGIEHKKPALLSPSWTNSGFTSEGSISGDGYIQYTITQTDNQRVMVGLTDETTSGNLHYNTIDYAIYTGYGTDRRVLVYKEGVQESFAATYCEIGDTFRVERAGNQILFKKNGVVFHGVTTSFTGTLVGDASFYDPDTAIENVYIGYSVMGQAFTQNVKGLATGSKVRVLDTNDWITTVSYYDEKGRGIHTSSKNDYLETTDAVSSLLDFSGKVLKTNTTHKQLSNDPVVTADEYVYDTGNRLLYQTKQINNQGKELMSKNHYDELGQLIQKQVGGSLPALSLFGDFSNITQDKEVLSKTTANNWDGGVSTTTTINGDGYLSYIVPQTNKTMIVGLSDVVGDNSYQSIKYGIYTSSIGDIHIRENGSTTWNVDSYVGGDELKIERRGTTVYYLKNNQIIFISNVIDNGMPLLGDVAMFHQDATIRDLVLVDLEKELQEVDYTYNIHGWLKGINDVNNQGDDLFSFALTYNDIADPSKQLFNGNISSTFWKTKGQDSSLKDYIYTYDPLNRIKSAVDNTANYNLDDVKYDLNGNITDLTRKGHLNAMATDFDIMDNLRYQYHGNQLLNVTDISNITSGFNDGNTNSSTDPTNANNDFVYDANGNMIVDKNKGITSISYNHLNLPMQITFDNSSSITYIYDATGIKQKKVVNDQSSETTQETQYAGNYIYKKSDAVTIPTLTFFNSEEGYVEPQFDPSKPEKIIGFNYTYQYKDHLGNIRLSYEDLDENGTIDPLTEIKEENHYYPFGLKHKGYNNVIVGRNHNYGFGGKEEQNELGLVWQDYGWRNYDASLGRWMNVDNAADEYVRWSPYSYSMNNPIYFIDPDGQRIKIGDNYYSYSKDRDYDKIENEFERDTYMALDKLYEKDALEFCLGDGCQASLVNVLEHIIEDEDVTLTITEGKKETGSRYNRRDNEIEFASRQGVLFIKDASKPVDKDNIGYNSPTSALGHEIIHSYNNKYDNENYTLRRNDTSTKGKIKSSTHGDLSFTNREEEYTSSLANQANEKLSEDKRTNYSIEYYETKNSTSIKPKK